MSENSHLIEFQPGFLCSNASDELVDKLRKHLLAAGYGAIAGFRVALLTYGNFQVCFCF